MVNGWTSKQIATNIRINAINKSKMEKKQNSIDWLLKKIWWEYRLIPNDDIIEEAKAMHKEEIEEAYMVGNHSEMRGGRAILEVTEKYYEQTFGGQDNE